MILRLKRIARKNTYTIGRLYINGERFCDTIEDVDRNLSDSMSVEEIRAKKKYCETAIPTGLYKVSITYSPKYKKQMPLIENVKGFEGIRIHSGNYSTDSCGCIIVGLNKKVGMVTDSRKIYEKLFKILQAEKGDIFIEIC